MLENKNRFSHRTPKYKSIDGFNPSYKTHPLSYTPDSSKNAPHASEKPIVSSTKDSQIPFSPTNIDVAPQKSSAVANNLTAVDASLLRQARPEEAASKKPRARSASNKQRTQRSLKKHYSWKRKISLLFIFLVVTGLSVGGWDIWQLDHKINHLAVGNLTTSVGGAENILVAGSTNRCNLKVQNAQWGFCSQGVTGVNSDIIFVVHVVPQTHTISVLSIPRDTFVPNARSGGQAFKIDAALYQGPSQLVKAIEEDYGIPIQHYAEVGFDGFVNIVNAVGGVKIDFPLPVYDSDSHLNVATPGCKLFNGVEALQVVRARHLQYKPATITTNDKYYWPQEVQSDIARIARTHEFLRILGGTVAHQGLGNPITDQKLVDAIAPQVQVDTGLSSSAMLTLAEEFHNINIASVAQYTLPITTTTFGGYHYNGNDYGDVVFPTEPLDQQIINKFLGVSNTIDTMTGKALPSPPSIKVHVVNGSGTLNQASQTSLALSRLGFSMVGIPSSRRPLSQQAVETVVYFASTTTEGKAEAVARQLSGPVILAKVPLMVTSGSDVTVLTGTNLTVNAPPIKTAQTTASSQKPVVSTSPAIVASQSSSAFAPASSATQPLAPWDPRSCPSN